jgi:thiol-disulfide isomerase/thioredoxin
MTPPTLASDRPAPRFRWVRLRSHLGTVVLMLIVFFGVQAWQTRAVSQGALPELVFTLIDTSGSRETTTLAAWRERHAGQPVALYLWAEWCPICKLQQPVVSALVGDVPVLTIAMQSGPPETVARVLAQRQLRWPTAVDPRGELSKALGFGSVPALVVIDANGQLRTPTVGYTSELGVRARLWWAGAF